VAPEGPLHLPSLAGHPLLGGGKKFGGRGFGKAAASCGEQQPQQQAQPQQQQPEQPQQQPPGPAGEAVQPSAPEPSPFAMDVLQAPGAPGGQFDDDYDEF
jgi:hypothetical protein